MISHVVGTMSDKSVFGQCGPKNKLKNFLNQTICRNHLNILKKRLNTMNISNIFSYSFLVINFVFLCNPQITKALIKYLSKFKIIKLSLLVGISETICLILTSLISRKLNTISYYYRISLISTPIYSSLLGSKEEPQTTKIGLINNTGIIPKTDISRSTNSGSDFFEWLSGIIDAKGHFISKEGCVSLEITIHIKDVRCLRIIRQYYGGSIKIKDNNNIIRYRLREKKGLLKLILDVNGLIRSSTRLTELANICDKYNLKLKKPIELTYKNAWFSGFFDGIGRVDLDSNALLTISIMHEDPYLLEMIYCLFGGYIYLSEDKRNFKWVLDWDWDIGVRAFIKYFKRYKPRSTISYRVVLIKKYDIARSYGPFDISKTGDNAYDGAWRSFLMNWKMYERYS
jgi:hypothetical protein